MRLSNFLCLVLVANCAFSLPALLADDSKSQKNDQYYLKLLQGDWKVVALEDDGMKAPSSMLKGMHWEFKGSEVQGADPGEELHDKSLVKLDSSKTPTYINLVGVEGPTKGQTWKGIFKFENERLVICMGETLTSERPTDFSTGPDSHRCMIAFERIKK